MSEDIPVTWPEVLAYMRRYYQTVIIEQRLGQAYFNALHQIHPEVADIVRTTDADPFYADKPWDPRMVRFYDTIIPYFV